MDKCLLGASLAGGRALRLALALVSATCLRACCTSASIIKSSIGATIVALAMPCAAEKHNGKVILGNTGLAARRVGASLSKVGKASKERTFLNLTN